jgi:hypothetical protein
VSGSCRRAQARAPALRSASPARQCGHQTAPALRCRPDRARTSWTPTAAIFGWSRARAALARSRTGSRPGSRFQSRSCSAASDGAAPESNRPSVGLPRLVLKTVAKSVGLQRVRTLVSSDFGEGPRAGQTRRSTNDRRWRWSRGAAEQSAVEEADHASLVLLGPGGDSSRMRRLRDLPDLLRFARCGVVLRVELLLFAAGSV